MSAGVLGLADPDRRDCHFIWFWTYRGSQEQSLESRLRRALGRQPLESERAAIGPVEYVKAEWQTKLLWDRGPDTIISIAMIDSTSSLCGDRATSALSMVFAGRNCHRAGGGAEVKPGAALFPWDRHAIANGSSR